jgi:hypothetical protein
MSESLEPSLLAQALDAHGGLERWRTLNTLSSTIVSGGRLWGLKGHDLGDTPRVVTTYLRLGLRGDRDRPHPS